MRGKSKIMKNRKIFLSVLLLFMLGNVGAQIELPGVELRLPYLKGWADGNHYLEQRWEGKKAVMYKVDALTGDTVRFTPQPAAVQNRLKIEAGDIVCIGPEGKKKLTETAAVEATPVLSPDGRWVAFTRDNDLYALELSTGREIRYTTDGSDVVKNGYASWVYYEEILGRETNYCAFWWSPDSRHLAFFRTDESMVPIFPIYNARGQHGYLENTRYPKAGDPNPEVNIAIVPVEGGEIVWADFNAKTDQYFGTPFWRPDGSGLMVQWMPREQNLLQLFEVNPADGSKQQRFREEQPTWIDWISGLYWLADGGFLVIRDFDGWEQIYLHNPDGSLRQKLTHGRKWKTQILRVDEKGKMVYFTSCGELSTRTDLYGVRFNGKDQRRLTFGEYSHKNISLSPDNSWFLTSYENVGTPTRMAVVNVKTGKRREITDSKEPEFDAKRGEYCQSEMLWMKTPEGFELPANITWPKNMQKDKKYPVVVQVYGGPNAGTVAERWIPLRFKTEENYIRISLDHRGSGHCGKVGMDYMHRNLGKWEMEDYIAWVKLLRTYPCVDSARIMITGASYGGYMTSMALTYGGEYFRYGFAKSGVVDWALYDSHYTERYMDRPQDNPEGYKAASVLTYADRYQTHGPAMLYLEHGMMDDNVHVQQCIQLVDTLQHLNRKFEMMFYPNERHSWIGVKMGFTGEAMQQFIGKYLTE